MSESRSHKRAKGKAAGKPERTLKSGKRVDSMSLKRATEVERSGSTQGIGKAIARLKESRKSQKVLQVPQKDFSKAVEIGQRRGLKGTVKNMGGTKRRHLKGR